MAHSRYEYSQPESMFPATDSAYQFQGSVPKDESHYYHNAEEKSYDERQNYPPVQNVTNTDESDLGTRSRLTQEQLATLEAEFAERYKPNTEYKKTLAEKMGVEFQKVNNWFQNRRAKAKHQNPQERRYDVSPEQDTHQAPATAFPSTEYEAMHQSYHLENFSSPAQDPILSTEFAAPFDFNLEEMNRQYNANMSGLPNFDNDSTLQADFPHTVGADPMWSADSYDILKVPAQSVVERDPFAWSPDSFHDASAQVQGQRFVHGNTNPQSQPMYHTAIDGSPVGNPSTQSFVTTSSEGGEHQDFMTPPQGTSPMRSLNQSIYPHRGSDSSDLAANFNTIHIQQLQTGPGALRVASNPASANALVSPTGLATPQVSPDAVISKSPFAPGSSDLAARKRRPRPLALQNDASRSVSYTGPVTSSSHLRASPPDSSKQSPVRRIRSTGNNLNVMTGRVTKPGTASAQMSPRNFESCFQLASSLSEPQPNASINAHISHTPHAEQSLLTPSSATFAPQAHAAWPNYAPNCSPLASSWEQSVHDGTTPSYAAQPGFSLPPSPPVYQNTASQIPYEQAHRQQQFPFHCPPQSAPPHLTSFFDASPPMVADGFNAGWPTPSVTPPESYRHGPPMGVPMRQNHTLHHSQSGPMNYFTGPQQNFLSSHPSIGSFQPYQPTFQSTPPAPKELDIKIDIGPPVPSQPGQEVKTYTFSHSTPKDFSPGNAKK